jgi:hypothetical protein
MKMKKEKSNRNENKFEVFFNRKNFFLNELYYFSVKFINNLGGKIFLVLKKY